MAVRSAWLLPGGAGPGQTREDTRLTPIGTMAPESELRSRDGVIAGGDPFAATGAGAMDLQIGVGRAVVQGTDAQGAYPIANDAPIVLTFPDGSDQFDRIDSVIIHVYDQLYDVDGKTLAQIEILPGEPSATPTAPTLPAACLRLWDVTVPAGASAGVGGIAWSSALADRRRYTASYGGIIPPGWGLSFAGGYDGQYRDAAGVLERWSAADGAWTTYRAPDPAAETTTSGATAQTGYSVLSFAARKKYGTCSFTIEINRTGSLISANSAGNIDDQPVARIPAGWRPAVPVEAAAEDGYGCGVALLGTDGDLRVRTWSPNGSIQNGRTIRISPCFVL